MLIFVLSCYLVTLTIGSGIELENTKIKGSRLSTRPFLFDTKKIKTKKIVLLLFDYFVFKGERKNSLYDSTLRLHLVGLQRLVCHVVLISGCKVTAFF